MAQTASNVTAAKPIKKTGAVFRAPAGTTLPVDASTALSTAYVPLGYVAEDGVTNSDTLSTSVIKAWGGDVVLTTVDEKSDAFKFTLIEALNPEVLKVVHGQSNVTGTLEKGIQVDAGSDELERGVWVIDMAMKNNVVKRIVIPDAEVTNKEDVTYAANAAVGYGITLTAYPSDLLDGKNHREYIKAAATATA